MLYEVITIRFLFKSSQIPCCSFATNNQNSLSLFSSVELINANLNAKYNDKTNIQIVNMKIIFTIIPLFHKEYKSFNIRYSNTNNAPDKNIIIQSKVNITKIPENFRITSYNVCYTKLLRLTINYFLIFIIIDI